MNIEVIKANALMNHLIEKVGVICQSPDQKCICYYYLHDLLQIFLYENNSLTLKQEKGRRPNQKF